VEEKENKSQRFMELQKLPYETKIVYAASKACEFYDKLNGKVFCSVGGAGQYHTSSVSAEICPIRRYQAFQYQAWRTRASSEFTGRWTTW